MNGEKIFLAALVVTVTVVFAWSVFGFFQSANLQDTPSNYNTFVSSEDPNNICATPSGYTDEQWKEHMSHHPDRYAQCLSK